MISPFIQVHLSFFVSFLMSENHSRRLVPLFEEDIERMLLLFAQWNIICFGAWVVDKTICEEFQIFNKAHQAFIGFRVLFYFLKFIVLIYIF